MFLNNIRMEQDPTEKIKKVKRVDIEINSV